MLLLICKMAKEMEVTHDFVRKQLICTLPNQTMDVVLKVRTKTGEHTFREDVYTRSLKYRRWNNQLRPFRLLKKRVANIFRKRASFLDDSRNTSTQSIINCMERASEERSVVGDNKRNSFHSDWSDLILIDEEAEYRKIQRPNIRPYTSNNPPAAPIAKTVLVPPSTSANVHKTVKNIVLVPHTPKSNNWGAWQVKISQLTTIAASPNSACSEPEQEQKEELGREEEEGELAYEPHSPYYSPVHLPEFYEDEQNFILCMIKIYMTIVYIFMDLVECVSKIISKMIEDCLCLNIKIKNVFKFFMYLLSLCDVNTLNVCYKIYLI